MLDAGAPRNAPAEGVHGLLGHDGIPPAALMERARAEVLRYGRHVVHADVVTAARQGQLFEGRRVSGRDLPGRNLS